MVGLDMDTRTAIMTRRSIRRYQDREVEEEKVQILLKAAMQAPSSRNSQPWHFIVVTERKTLDAIPAFHPHAKMLLQAPLGIAVCGDTGIEESVEYINSNCSAVTQNLLLAAHDLGLGAVWLGIYPRQERIEGIRRLLALPERIIPISLIAFGYPAEEKEPQDRFRQERVHWQVWEG
jgi:nitroreductase